MRSQPRIALSGVRSSCETVREELVLGDARRTEIGTEPVAQRELEPEQRDDALRREPRPQWHPQRARVRAHDVAPRAIADVDRHHQRGAGGARIGDDAELCGCQWQLADRQRERRQHLDRLGAVVADVERPTTAAHRDLGLDDRHLLEAGQRAKLGHRRLGQCGAIVDGVKPRRGLVDAAVMPLRHRGLELDHEQLAGAMQRRLAAALRRGQHDRTVVREIAARREHAAELALAGRTEDVGELRAEHGVER